MGVNIVRETIKDDIPTIAFNLREADKAEIYASTGNRLYYATLLKSFELSEKCYTWTINDKPTMVLGVCEGGVVWAMGTDDMLNEKAYFLKEAGKYIKDFLEGYDKIYNYVYTKNVVHINWLRRVGFEFAKEPVTLKNGEKFIYFSMEE